MLKVTVVNNYNLERFQKYFNICTTLAYTLVAPHQKYFDFAFTLPHTLLVRPRHVFWLENLKTYIDKPRWDAQPENIYKGIWVLKTKSFVSNYLYIIQTQKFINWSQECLWIEKAVQASNIKRWISCCGNFPKMDWISWWLKNVFKTWL